jgi:hypothetical protein
MHGGKGVAPIFGRELRATIEDELHGSGVRGVHQDRFVARLRPVVMRDVGRRLVLHVLLARPVDVRPAVFVAFNDEQLFGLIVVTKPIDAVVPAIELPRSKARRRSRWCCEAPMPECAASCRQV